MDLHGLARRFRVVEPGDDGVNKGRLLSAITDYYPPFPRGIERVAALLASVDRARDVLNDLTFHVRSIIGADRHFSRSR
jgi:hypothetical protein